MDGKYQCCIACSSDVLFQTTKEALCFDCRFGFVNGKRPKRDYAIYTSKYPISYYKNLSIEKYGTSNRWHEVFVETELSHQPLFSLKRYHIYLQNQSVRDARKKDINAHIDKIEPKSIRLNTPTCPTCGSTDLRKISDFKRAGHWLAFGFLSQTARSQWECENCGYKW